ncbi:PIG-L deacetylase family protein [Streptomyces sp. NPDC051940]|uniref:PIG-L deacetylase family protein n=1 Tax=Streptomyces sp. NPDC051940 TaxID=3155675 RepID=UPI00342F09BF
MTVVDLTRRDARLRILAVGAHPDDIELGAGALMAKAGELDHRVSLLILTDEDGCGPQRRRESVRAAAELGVDPGDVVFAGFRDGGLRADGDSVRRVRDLMRRHRIRPDVVVTHTLADSHNDHVEAHRIAHAAFRNTAFLHYSIHISSEIDRFSPRVFIRLTPERLGVKDRALGCFPSQQTRISRLDLAKYEAKLGQLARMDRAEGFEVGIQYGTQDALLRTIGLSDSAFHRFWEPVVADGRITLLYEAVCCQGPQALIHRNSAQDMLRQSFIDCWPPPYPLREHYANTDEALVIAAGGSIVTTGSAESNQIARKLRQSGRVAWDVADGGLRDLATGRRHPGHVGYLARIESPFQHGALAVTTAGATEFASRTGVELLADPGSCPELADVFDRELIAQVAYSVDVATGALEVLDVQHGTVFPKGP